MLTDEELEALQKKYCQFCGTQRCHGMFDEVCREGCEHYQKANGTYEEPVHPTVSEKMDYATMWFITVFERVECDQKGFPDFGSSRCWGFYSDRGVAIRAVRENWTDMREGMYEYAVVEGFDEGISGGHDPAESQWFKWDDENACYKEIEQPAVVAHCANWAMG